MDNSKFSINVNGSILDWDTNDGTVLLENEEVVMFWINTTFKAFVDAMEEIATPKAARLILETAGYRTGRTVSAFYLDTMGSIEEITAALPNIYKTAGWGMIDLKFVSLEEKKAVVRVKNSWEYKLSLSQQKKQEGAFFPGHWAGVFSGLFGSTVWYKCTKSQLDGFDYSEFEFFASEITPTQNIYSLAEEHRIAELSALEQKVEQRTKELSTLVQEISSPIIPVLENILVIPLVGKYDEDRAEDLISRTLLKIPGYKSKYLILDLTGTHDVNEFTMALIQKMVMTTSLLGMKGILAGISPELAVRIVASNYNLNKIPCFSSLRDAILFALDEEGLYIAKKKE